MSEMLYSRYIAFTPLEVNAMRKEDESLIILDTRTAAVFANGFIPGAIFIGHDGSFTEWSVNLLPVDKKIIVVAPAGKEEMHIDSLVNAGFKNVAGYLEDGFEAWQSSGLPIDMIIDVDAGELAMDLPFDQNLVVVDVRKPVEFAEGHVANALNIPLIDLTDPGNLADLDDHHNLYLHSSAGYRSVIAASLLKQQGYNNLRNITGGWNAIKHTKGITIEKDAAALN